MLGVAGGSLTIREHFFAMAVKEVKTRFVSKSNKTLGYEITWELA
jgi:hypothetical protein